MENFVNDEKSSDTNLSLNSEKKHIGISDLFGNLLHGIIVCSHRLLGIGDSRLADEKEILKGTKYTKIQSEVAELKERRFESKKQLKEFAKKSKQLNLLEVQAKLAQIKQSKKKFSKFWKRHD